MLRAKKPYKKPLVVASVFIISACILIISLGVNLMMTSIPGIGESISNSLEVIRSADNLSSPLNETRLNRGLIFMEYDVLSFFIVIGIFLALLWIGVNLSIPYILYLISIYTGKPTWNEWREQMTKDMKKLSELHPEKKKISKTPRITKTLKTGNAERGGSK